MSEEWIVLLSAPQFDGRGGCSDTYHLPWCPLERHHDFHLSETQVVRKVVGGFLMAFEKLQYCVVRLVDALQNLVAEFRLLEPWFAQGTRGINELLATYASVALLGLLLEGLEEEIPLTGADDLSPQLGPPKTGI